MEDRIINFHRIQFYSLCYDFDNVRYIETKGLTYGNARNLRDNWNENAKNSPFYLVESFQRTFKGTRLEFETYLNELHLEYIHTKPILINSTWVKNTEAKRIKDFKPESSFPMQGTPIRKYDYEPNKGDFEKIQPIQKALSAIWTVSPKSIIHEQTGTKPKHKGIKSSPMDGKSLFKYYTSLYKRSGYTWKDAKKAAKIKLYGNK